MVKPFERQSSRKVLETPIFDLREDVATHPVTGKDAPYVVLESPDWVNVVAVTEAGEFVLVRQWRHGTRTVELEFPAGLVDEGESPIEAAARELREETGYVAQSMTIIGEVAPNAAFQDNVCTTVLAEGCRKVAEQSLDGGEDIEVLVVPESEIRDLFRTRKLRNGMVGVALMWWCDHTGRTVWR